MNRPAAILALVFVACSPAFAEPKKHAVSEKPTRTITLTINGTLLPRKPPPIVKKGHLLLPLRSVFEALALTVERRGDAVGTQAGSKTIEVVPGRLRATVDGAPVQLEFPATEEHGVLYVPAGFFADALGAQVSFDPKTANVIMTSALVGKSSVNANFNGRTVVRGVVTALDTNSLPPSVTVTEGASVRTIAISSSARVLIQDVQARTSTGAVLQDLRVGDALQATINKNGSVEEIVGLFASRTGKVAATNGSSIVLGDGHVIVPGRETEVSINGDPAKIAELKVGDVVVVRYNPETSEMRQIIAARPDKHTAPPPGSVAISSVRVSAARPLRAGERFTVTLTGTPGGHASFDIGSYVIGVPLRETSPGAYSGGFTVPRDVGFPATPIFGRLRVGATDAPRRASEAEVAVSSTAPIVSDIAPEAGQVINNPQPSIYATFTAGDVGVNPSSIQLIVNGSDVTSSATRTAAFITYTPAMTYPNGAVKVVVRVADFAGNGATKSWTFSIKSK